MELEMIIMSASRPELLEETLRSFNKNVKFSGNIRKILHEDVCEEELLQDVLDICEYHNVKYFVDKPVLGLEKSITSMLDMIKGKYVIVWQDDWKLLHKIDFDKILHIMDNNLVNQIIFHKRDIKPTRGLFEKKEVVFNDVILTTNWRWSELPSIWNLDFIKPYWEENFNCISWGLAKKMPITNAEDVISRYGIYYYGAIGSGHMVEHIGKKIRRYNPNSIYKES